MVTKEQLKRVLPKKIQVSDELIDSLNNMQENEQYLETFRDNLLGFSQVLTNNNFNINQYVSAVKYVSYKLMGSSNVEAYTKTFPDRFQRLISEGADDKTISRYVAAYNKGQLVNKILEQTLVPTHILNADIYQKAINTQAELMVTAKSEKVRSDAANSLLTHLKAPETTKIEMDIGIKQDKSIDDLRKATEQLVQQQRQMLEEKIVSTQEVAHSEIIEAEIVG